MLLSKWNGKSSPHLESADPVAGWSIAHRTGLDTMSLNDQIAKPHAILTSRMCEATLARLWRRKVFIKRELQPLYCPLKESLCEYITTKWQVGSTILYYDNHLARPLLAHPDTGRLMYSFYTDSKSITSVSQYNICPSLMSTDKVALFVSLPSKALCVFYV